MATPKTRKRAMRSQRKQEKELQAVERPLDERVALGEVRVGELETLKLQKLMHQAQNLMRQGREIEQEIVKIRKKVQEKTTEFQLRVKEVKEKYGLAEWHDIDLTDENGGLVTYNQGTKDSLAKQEAEKAEGEKAEG